MIKPILALAIAGFLALSSPAIAELVEIDTNVDVIAETSFSTGGYIFETSTGILNLIDGPEDFIVWNSFSVPVTMRRLDGQPFSLLSMREAGNGTTLVGGVSVTPAGSLNFQDFHFANQPGVTHVQSILFDIPIAANDHHFQLAAFEVTVVPEPHPFVLLGVGLLALRLLRLRESVTC
jgi:hypothetical protein